jgi:hypothetical protein
MENSDGSEADSLKRHALAECLRSQDITADLHSHSSMLEHVGLVATLRGLSEEIGEKYKIDARFIKHELTLVLWPLQVIAPTAIPAPNPMIPAATTSPVV